MLDPASGPSAPRSTWSVTTSTIGLSREHPTIRPCTHERGSLVLLVAGGYSANGGGYLVELVGEVASALAEIGRGIVVSRF